MRLYKYLPKESYARAFLNEGEIYMQTLSYFRRLEDGFVRGDPDDGKLCYEPNQGLEITKANSEIIKMPPGWRFRASVQANDIFVYCMSTDLSPEIAEKFECPFCIEIKKPARLISRILTHVRLRSILDRNGIYSREVVYREQDTAPGVDWALPERVAFFKPQKFAWQREHRIVVGRKGAFAVENVVCALGADVGNMDIVATNPNPLILRIGDLSKIAELHSF